MDTAAKSKRIDITLPAKTIDQIDVIWRDYGFSSRSSFLEQAAKNMALRLKRAELKRKLKVGYKMRAERDAEINRELEILDNEIV
jgi:metal-responsive CopG/Arc/MetJ family transcriptional regulator